MIYLSKKERKLLPSRKGDGLTNHQRVILQRMRRKMRTQPGIPSELTREEVL